MPGWVHGMMFLGSQSEVSETEKPTGVAPVVGVEMLDLVFSKYSLLPCLCSALKEGGGILQALVPVWAEGYHPGVGFGLQGPEKNA